MESTVVDYVMANTDASLLVSSFHVTALFDDDGDMISDHTALLLTLNLSTPTTTQLSVKHNNYYLCAPILPTSTDLDRLLITTLSARQTQAAHLHNLYGPISTTTNPTIVYVDGSCHANGTDAAHAGSGIFFG
ncbi:hypothetical protein Hypma_004698 [Hypsizygus marmoreus]|uniref:Uncharacterized protein n=1 Tax=Hypsizygus marmoreus TaxID=39966 RepID=A0A369J1M0_HYPMA|nr:hypothetical protein Hypma_004698 [Hypsizygus marmoreus]